MTLNETRRFSPKISEYLKTYAFYSLVVVLIRSDRELFGGVFVYLFLFCVYLFVSGLIRDKSKVPVLFFGAYVAVASFWITNSWKSLQTIETSSAGVQNFSEVQQGQFDELAESYITEDEFQSGVIAACSDLFSISPDGYLYQNNISLSQGDCENWGGSYTGFYDLDPYLDGYAATIEEMFLETPYWCWGTDCLTTDDF